MSRPEPTPGWTLNDPAPTPSPGFELTDSTAEVPLRQSILAAADKQPDRHAKVLALAKKTGMAPAIVERNFDAVQKHAETASTPYAQMLRETPKTAEFLSDPDNAAIAKDDHPQLGHIETLLNLGKSFVGGAQSGAGQALEGASSLLDVTGRAYNRAIQALGLPAIHTSLPWWLSPLKSAGGELQADSQFFQPSKQTFGTQVAGSLGQLVPLIGSAIFAGPEAATALFAGQGAEGMDELAKQLGKEGTPAADVGVLSGAAIGALAGEFGIEKLLERVPPAVKNIFLQKLADVTLSGGYQAGLQVAMDLANNVATQLTLDPKHPLTGDLLEQAAIGGATGAIARGILGIALPSLGGKLERMEAAKRNKSVFEALGQGVTDSKTFQRLPEKLQQFVLSATKDGPIENVYLPAEETAQFFQDNKLDPDEVLGEGTREKLNQAVASGQDLQLSTADYAAKLAPSEHAKFFNDIVRLGNPEAMNAREGEEFSKTASGEIPSDSQQFPSDSAEKVGEDIRGQLLGQGFDPKVVDSYASLYEAGFRSMGERSGQDPFALYEPYRLKITRPLPEILRTLPNIDTQLDPLIDRLRSGQRPTPEEMLGKSLGDFLREAGGVKDEGGDLASREPDKERKPFEKRLLNAKGLALDRAREMAAEAGYIDKQSSIADFLDAITKDVGGKPVYAQGAENPEAVEQNIILEQLDQYLKQRDVDVRTASNAEIKKVLKDASEVPVIDAASGTLLAQPLNRNYNDLLFEFARQRAGSGLQPAVLGDSGKIYTGAWHGEAINKAMYSNDLTTRVPEASGERWTPHDEVPASHQGFLTKEGRFLTREQADKEFGIKFSEDIALDQTLGLDKRGTIHFGPDRKFSIDLLRDADLSTFLHETGHFYLEVFRDIVDELKGKGELSPTQQRMVADYNTALQWLGVESRDKIGRDQHEQFARGFEAYLREGKAPNPELRSIFQRFKAWLVNIYRSVSQLNVSLSPEVRGVFDRLLASDEQIGQARQDADIRAMIESQGQAERLGLSPDEYRVYGKTVQDARDRAQENLDRQYLDEFNRASSDWYTQKRDNVRSEVANEVHSQKQYMVLSFLKDGKLPDGSPLPEGVEPFKLDAKALEERYGKHKDSTVMQQLRKLDIYRREGGVDPDAAAEQFGYSSGDELVQAMVNARPMDALIDAETDDRMKHTYGDMLTDGTAPEKARDAVMTEGRSKVIEAEMKALAKKLREDQPVRNLAVKQTRQADRSKRAQGLDTIRRFVPSVSLARDIAESRIAEMRVRDVKASVYYAAAKRESNAALEAVNSGDFDSALTHKQRELVNVEMYKSATDTVKEVDKIRERMRSYDDPKKRGRIGKAGEEYLDQIDKLRERFEFSRQTNKALDKRASLLDFMKSEEAKGHELDIPLELQNEARTQNYRDMTVEQLRGLHDAVQTIEHWANFKNKLLRNVAKRELDQLEAEGAGTIGRTGKPRKPRLEPDLPRFEPGRAVRAIDLGQRPLHHIMRELDGFTDGFFFDNVTRPVQEARDQEMVMGRETAAAYRQLHDEAYRGREAELYHETFIPELNGSLSKMGAVVVALNNGNEGNRERLHSSGIGNTRGLNDGQIRAIIDTLDERDWKFVEGIAKLVNSHREDIGALYKRVTGVAPEWVEPTPFQTKFGEMPGWYYPIDYSGRASARGLAGKDANLAKIAESSSYMRLMTRNGHTQARTETTGIPLKGNFSVIGDHLTQVIHDLTHREMLLDVGRLLGRKGIQDAIYQNYGDQYYASIKSAFRDITVGPQAPPDWFRLFQGIRRRGSIARLAWNFGTMARHITNITSGMVRVGPVDVTKAIFKNLGSASGEMYSRAWIEANDPFMAGRWNQRLEETASIANEIRMGRGQWASVMRDAAEKVGINPDIVHSIGDSFLYGIHKIIETAEIPTWIAAYDKSLEAGPHDPEAHPRAVASAKAAVADAFGSGAIHDLPSVQRNYVGKLFTTFMQYGLSSYRLNYEIYNKKAPLTRKLVDAALLNVVPIVLLSGIFYELKPHKKETFQDELVNEGIDHAVGQVILTRELAGFARNPDYQGPAAFSTVGEAKRLLFQTYRAIKDESGAKAEKAFATAEEFGSELAGVPLQLEKTAEGILALWEGKTHDPSAVLFGTPRSK